MQTNRLIHRLRANQTASVITVLAIFASLLSIAVSKDYAISALLLWIASGLLWWNRPCATAKKDIE